MKTKKNNSQSNKLIMPIDYNQQIYPINFDYSWENYEIYFDISDSKNFYIGITFVSPDIEICYENTHVPFRRFRKFIYKFLRELSKDSNAKVIDIYEAMPEHAFHYGIFIESQFSQQAHHTFKKILNQHNKKCQPKEIFIKNTMVFRCPSK